MKRCNASVSPVEESIDDKETLSDVECIATADCTIRRYKNLPNSKFLSGPLQGDILRHRPERNIHRKER
jgi:hypothetical protein